MLIAILTIHLSISFLDSILLYLLRFCTCLQIVTIDTMPAAAAVMQTAPFDPRFPNTNQTRYCYQSYLDFHRCQKVKGEAYSPCNYFKKVYGSICPNSWTEKWDDQRENGTFAGKI